MSSPRAARSPSDDARNPGADGPEVGRLDSRRLKALAHPLRARLLAALRTEGPATASQLAATFDTNSGQTSYHLRVLADAGLVDEDATRGTARERYWRARHQATHIDLPDFDQDPGDRERLVWLLRMSARLQDRMFARWLDEMHTYPVAWRQAADMSDHRLRLTPDQLQSLTRELAEVVARYPQAAPEDRDRPDGAEDEQVLVVLRAFPTREVDLR